jgi:hypothetical protein
MIIIPLLFFPFNHPTTTIPVRRPPTIQRLFPSHPGRTSLTIREIT